MTSQLQTITIHKFCNISQSKDNQKLKFGQLIHGSIIREGKVCKKILL